VAVHHRHALRDLDLCAWDADRVRHLESEPVGELAPIRNRLGAQSLEIVTSALRSGRRAAGAATGFEHP